MTAPLMNAPHTNSPPKVAPLTLWRHARLATFAGSSGWGLIDNGALLTAGEHIRWLGTEADLPGRAQLGLEPQAEHDLQGALVTPGLIDAHTHLIYGGDRAAEFELRLQGASYEDIARAGGGIRSTVAATRAASDESLFTSAAARARTLVDEGVTTLEIKSGYGLSAEHEARCLAVARRIGRELPLTVRTTSLAAHAVPAEYAGRADAYIDEACSWLAAQQSAGLVDAVDAFCDTIGFTPAQTERIFNAAKQLGLPVKLHAEQLSDQNGAALAARYGALSCDRHQRDEKCGHGGGAAARRLLLFARHETAAGAGFARRRHSDSYRHRPQPRLITLFEPAADVEHGLHAVPPDTR